MRKVILFSIIYCFIIISKGFAFINQIVVNQNMSFGTIQYKDVPSIYTIDKNNALQSNNMANNYGVNSKLALITVYGEPEDEVTLNFGAAKLVGNMGEITLSNIEVIGGGNTIKLDKTGKAKVEISGTLNVNNQNIIGSYQGVFTVWASYKNTKIDATASQKVAVSANLVQRTGSVVKNLNFGNILYKRNAACSVTISTSNTISHNCVSVTGAQRFEYKGTTMWVMIPPLVSLATLPGTVLILGKGGDSLTINNFKVVAQITGSTTWVRTYALYIGATLNIPKNAKGGTYSGTYNVVILIP